MIKLIDVNPDQIYYTPVLGLGLFKFYKAREPGWLRGTVEVFYSERYSTAIIDLLELESGYVTDFRVHRAGDSFVLDIPKIRVATKAQIQEKMTEIEAKATCLRASIIKLEKANLRLRAFL